MLEAALEFWNAIKGKVEDAVKDKTRNALRIERYDVTTPPNGSVVGVTQPFGSKELFIPYSQEVASAQVGDTVLVVWWNALSTAKAYFFGGGYDGGNGHYLGLNPISSPENDTIANWQKIGSGWAWYNQENYLIGQPSRWGFLFNYVQDKSGLDIFQIWHEQSDGHIWYRSGNGNTEWWSGSWHQVASSSDISYPVTSVNGLTGAVKVISDSAPAATSTAAQCLSYAQSHPHVMFVWARWQAATYTPVQTNAAWVYTMYTTYTDSSQYVVFEAQNNTTGDVYRCMADGTWAHLARENVRVTSNLSAAVAVANNTWTTLTNITLSPGTWLVNGVVSFPANATGLRRAILAGASGTSGSSRYWDDIQPGMSNASTTCRFTGLTTISSQTTYYLRVQQTSGASMNVSQYSGVDAIRLI